MELKITKFSIPDEITFNYEELKREIKETLRRYEGLVYSADQLKQAKADKAALNKLRKALNDERIKREREYMQPFALFKAEIADLIQEIDKPVQKIDEQVKAFEEQRRAEKLEKIKELFAAAGFPDWLKFEQVFIPSWLNSTVSLKSIEGDLAGMRITIASDMVVLSELPEFSFEATEAYKLTLNLKDSVEKGKAWAEVARRKAEAEKLKAEEEARKAAETAQRPAEVPAADLDKQVDDLQNEYHAEMPAPESFWISFKALLTIEQAKSLRAFFLEHGIKFEKI